MKYSLLIFSLLISSFCLAQNTADQGRTITVTAEASRKVEPNIGYLDFEVSSIHEDLIEAKKINDQKVKDILAFLKKQKFDSRDIKTIAVNFSQHREFNTKPEDQKKYRAYQLFRAILNDLDQYEPVTTELIQRGAANLNSLQLSHTDLQTFKTDLISEALENARKKAEGMAKKLGSQVGKALQIFDDQSFLNPSPFSDGQLNEVVLRGGAQTGTLALGSLTISTKVRVVFALE